MVISQDLSGGDVAERLFDQVEPGNIFQCAGVGPQQSGAEDGDGDLQSAQVVGAVDDGRRAVVVGNLPLGGQNVIGVRIVAAHHHVNAAAHAGLVPAPQVGVHVDDPLILINASVASGAVGHRQLRDAQNAVGELGTGWFQPGGVGDHGQLAQIEGSGPRKPGKGFCPAFQVFHGFS